MSAHRHSSMVRALAGLLLAGALLGVAGSLILVTPAAAQVVEPTPSPDPTPTPTPTPTPDPSPTPTPTPPPDPRPTVQPPVDPFPGGGGVGGKHDHADADEDKADKGQQDWHGYRPSTSGAFSTAALDQVAAKLRANGVVEGVIARGVYRPFILEGPAAWSDSWHAPRYAGGFHLHEGQDVLCRYGAPVLAAEPGRLEFGSNSLGGLVAYIRQPDGGFLYYAHLSAWRDGWNGKQVEPGDVIGSCGASGDATVPHVHFGWYGPDGEARNPMNLLVGLLHTAERRAGVLGVDADPSIRIRSTGNEVGSETPIVAPLAGSELAPPARAVNSFIPDGDPFATIADPFVVSLLVIGAAVVPSILLSRRSRRRQRT